MAEAEEEVEQTLHVARAVSVYRIPPRPGVSGWRSGEWLMSDKLFSGRMRMMAKGELCEIRLEDPNSSELFAMCPVEFGQRNVCIEPVTDSSRYYVLRVEDPTTHRHAFLGMGFDNRSDAFDFNEALVRHEQQVARERAARAKAVESAATSCAGAASAQQQPQAPTSRIGTAPSAANSSATAEVEGLYRHTAGLRLEEGQTIRVNVSGLKKQGGPAPGGGGFLSNAGATLAAPREGGLVALPSSSSHAASAHESNSSPAKSLTAPSSIHGYQQPPSNAQGTSWSSSGQLRPPQVIVAQADLLNVGGTSAAATHGSQASITTSPATASGLDNWATFD